MKKLVIYNEDFFCLKKWDPSWILQIPKLNLEEFSDGTAVQVARITNNLVFKLLQHTTVDPFQFPALHWLNTGNGGVAFRW